MGTRRNRTHTRFRGVEHGTAEMRISDSTSLLPKRSNSQPEGSKKSKTLSEDLHQTASSSYSAAFLRFGVDMKVDLVYIPIDEPLEELTMYNPMLS